MKKMTKKEFTRETMNVIKNLETQELEMVRKGLYTIYKKLNERDLIQYGKLNELSSFLRTITNTAALEIIERCKEL